MVVGAVRLVACMIAAADTSRGSAPTWARPALRKEVLVMKKILPALVAGALVAAAPLVLAEESAAENGDKGASMMNGGMTDGGHRMHRGHMMDGGMMDGGHRMHRGHMMDGGMMDGGHRVHRGHMMDGGMTDGGM